MTRVLVEKAKRAGGFALALIVAACSGNNSADQNAKPAGPRLPVLEIGLRWIISDSIPSEDARAFLSTQSAFSVDAFNGRGEQQYTQVGGGPGTANGFRYDTTTASCGIMVKHDSSETVFPPDDTDDLFIGVQDQNLRIPASHQVNQLIVSHNVGASAPALFLFRNIMFTSFNGVVTPAAGFAPGGMAGNLDGAIFLAWEYLTNLNVPDDLRQSVTFAHELYHQLAEQNHGADEDFFKWKYFPHLYVPIFFAEEPGRPDLVKRDPFGGGAVLGKLESPGDIVPINTDGVFSQCDFAREKGTFQQLLSEAQTSG